MLMKKKMWVLGLLMLILCETVACSMPQKTCKQSGCDETDIYKDGCCKYHYYLHSGEDIIKDIVN